MPCGDGGPFDLLVGPGEGARCDTRSSASCRTDGRWVRAGRAPLSASAVIVARICSYAGTAEDVSTDTMTGALLDQDSLPCTHPRLEDAPSDEGTGVGTRRHQERPGRPPHQGRRHRRQHRPREIARARPARASTSDSQIHQGATASRALTWLLKRHHDRDRLTGMLGHVSAVVEGPLYAEVRGADGIIGERIR